MVDLVPRRVFLDAAGVALGTVPDPDAVLVKTLALPAGLDVRGLRFAQVIEAARAPADVASADFFLADYLPDYLLKLLADLETALAQRRTVYLWDPAGRLQATGYPFPPDLPCWTDTAEWYCSAQDALHHANPVRMENLP